MIIRKALQKDSHKIASLHTQSWRTTYRGMLSDSFLDGPIEQERAQLWESRLKDNPQDQLVLIAEEAEKLTGFICVYLKRDPTWGALIDNLHVTATQRSKGLGTKLMLEAAKWINQEDPNTPVYLWAYEKNTFARRFYKNLSGHEVESRPEPSADGGKVMSVRYTWKSPSLLLRALQDKNQILHFWSLTQLPYLQNTRPRQ